MVVKIPQKQISFNLWGSSHINFCMLSGIVTLLAVWRHADNFFQYYNQFITKYIQQGWQLNAIKMLNNSHSKT